MVCTALGETSGGRCSSGLGKRFVGHPFGRKAADEENIRVKAVVYSNYGSPDVLKCEEIEKLAAGDNEAFTGVRAAAVNPFDGRLVKCWAYSARVLFGYANQGSRGQEFRSCLPPVRYAPKIFRAFSPRIA